MYILGLATMGEAAVALINDGEIVFAAEEERYSRKKHHIGFPAQALDDALRRAGIRFEDIDHVAHYWQPWILTHRVAHTLSVATRGLDLFLARAKRGQKQVRGHYLPMFTLPHTLRKKYGGRFKFHYVEHHLAHAASVFLTSPFTESAVFSYDGTGESTTTFFAHGRGEKISVLDRVKLPHSIGQFYSAFTNFLGFDMFAGDEYKVMGMAGWGTPRFYDYLSKNVLQPKADGTFRLDVTFLDHHLAKHRRYSDKAVAVLGPPRNPGEPFTQRHFDIAASVQKAMEETVFHMLRHLARRTGSKNLCLAGGCALNSLLNGKIQDRTPFENLYFHPAAMDAGGALGAALQVYHQVSGRPRQTVLDHSYLGPDYTVAECRQAAAAAGLDIEELALKDVPRRGAALLAEGHILGWFMGRLEWGPRALGHRSFLADPRKAEMKEIINDKIKLREPFRPFAPSMLQEASKRYFGREIDAPFMIQVFAVQEARRAEIPAVVHVDGTARPQMVKQAVNPRYWQLIKEFENITGVPVILNTSFNVQEPIVNTPKDAVQTFLNTRVEHLFLENLLVTKPQSDA
jgi:carbamoyltransferase